MRPLKVVKRIGIKLKAKARKPIRRRKQSEIQTAMKSALLLKNKVYKLSHSWSSGKQWDVFWKGVDESLHAFKTIEKVVGKPFAQTSYGRILRKQLLPELTKNITELNETFNQQQRSIKRMGKAEVGETSARGVAIRKSARRLLRVVEVIAPEKASQFKTYDVFERIEDILA